jgi:hypothetical protein
MRTPIGSALSAIVLGALAAGSSHAQVGYTTTTLEGMVAGSEVVVRATVAEVARGSVKEERCWETVTLKVRETLRGPTADSLTFAHKVYFSDRIFEAWRDAGREHLWFFVRNDEHREQDRAGDKDLSARYPLVLQRVVRLGPTVPAEEGFGPPGQGPWTLPVFSLDLKLLSEPEEILRAARASAAEWRGRGRAKVHPIDLSRVVMEKSGRSGDANRLDVPVDHHLETLARRLIKSPVDFVASSDFLTPKDETDRRHVENWLRSSKDLLRREGIRALRHFRSEENSALLMPLLNDPAFWALNKQENGSLILENGAPIEIGREYYIRKEAFATLRKWGVEVVEPVIEELHRPGSK